MTPDVVTSQPSQTTPLLPRLPLPTPTGRSSRASFQGSNPHANSNPLSPGSVLIVASYLLVWVSQSEYAQILLTGEGAAEGVQYNKPGFVCYLNHVVLVFYFPIIYVILLVTRGPGSFTAFIMSWCGNFSMSKALKEVTLIAVVYWVCIWTWVVGLTYISVSASNALYQLQVRKARPPLSSHSTTSHHSSPSPLSHSASSRWSLA